MQSTFFITHSIIIDTSFSFSFFLLVYTLLSQWGFIPWKIRVAFPKESQLQQSRATQPTLMKLHAGSFRVSIIHRRLDMDYRIFYVVRDYSYACVHTKGLGNTDKRVSTTFFHSEKNLSTHFYCTPDAGGVRTSDLWISNPRTLYQLSHPVTPVTFVGRVKRSDLKK